jgi:hypothetical protein
MPSFVDISYDTLVTRASRIEEFFGNLSNKLIALGVPATYYQDIYYDGDGNVRRVSDNEKIQTLSMFEREKYYDQGLGLMKIAMNKYLYPG